MKYLIYFTLFTLSFVKLTFSQTFESAGIYYNIITTAPEFAVEVTNHPDSYGDEVIIPDFVSYNSNNYTVKGIGFKAFADLYSSQPMDLLIIEIPNTVTYIADSAFFNCDINDLTLPSSLDSIGDYAFSSSGLSMIQIPDAVQNIGKYCFSNCQYLGYVIVGNSITHIKEGTFHSCFWLNSIVLPSNLLDIGNKAFFDTKLMSIEIPNTVTNIGEQAFLGCSILDEITIPNSCTNIGQYAFYICNNLSSVNLSNSITNINDYTFSGCSLDSIDIPNSVKTIGSHAFEFCNLESLVISDSLRFIGPSAFSSNYNLVDIKVGISVDSIGTGAFSSCPNLQSIQCCRPEPSLILGPFYNIDISAINLIVPTEFVSEYQDAQYWQDMTISGISQSLPSPQLCLVTVNDDQENEIIWDKYVTDMIQFYRIYKESSVPNDYSLICEVSYDSVSSYVDENSQSQEISNRYKISYVCFCGQESELSNYHQTVLLNVEEGANTNQLTWEPYIGVSISAINILRGNTLDNLQIIAELGASATEFLDDSPLPGINYYRVQIVLESECNPSKTYFSILSNIVSIDFVLNSNVHSNTNTIYPNPSKDFIYLYNINEINEIVIYNSLGRKVITSSTIISNQFDVSNLENGIYYVYIEYKKHLTNIKLIKE